MLSVNLPKIGLKSTKISTFFDFFAKIHTFNETPPERGSGREEGWGRERAREREGKGRGRKRAERERERESKRE